MVHLKKEYLHDALIHSNASSIGMCSGGYFTWLLRKHKCLFSKQSEDRRLKVLSERTGNED